MSEAKYRGWSIVEAKNIWVADSKANDTAGWLIAEAKV